MQAARRSTEPAHYFQHGPPPRVLADASSWVGRRHAIGASLPFRRSLCLEVAARGRVTQAFPFSGPVCLVAPAGVRLDAGAGVGPESARVRPALGRGWQWVCRRRRIESALIRRAIIIPELLVAEIDEGADHEGEG